MSNYLTTNRTTLDQLLVQLQVLYQQLIEQELSSRADYYQQRIQIIEQARIRLSLHQDACLSILDEFMPEYEIISKTLNFQNAPAWDEGAYMGLGTILPEDLVG
ncbi:hypothetical protein [Spirosoma linguale]|uniref:Uncharacterized protein n=1 Tax=Spirosoma linguale (strain ATCC 33905 / DSM 74 / LMG 10896 / Claus 1) TaxID=504472 RepID=D2QI30_SPILD|nr:hypothetical protein Slin_0861 [Spirosoma linguale DSM 74]